MGKYDKLKKTLPAFTLEPDFQAKVNEAKSSYQALNSAEIAREFVTLRAQKQNSEASIKMLNIELEACSQLLIEQLESAGIQKIQLNGGLSCYLQSEPYSSVENRKEMIAYLKKHKMLSMLTVSWQSLNAVNKERLIAGQSPLPGSKVFLKTSARLRGANQGEE